ncbi:hypothetical protein N7463_004156 [Penicillium fimorum]|uniref:Uncharacterized protein n=1 Tax=Penicillium fimorum TaxID=1882269 RepID=A0A9W9Y414_9EURO|nr:hypothetical protein N7463_004156 [Penicillium fimorum]
MEQTMEDYSCGERQYQPGPTVANRANGQNTLFRPFTSDSSLGTKIVVEYPAGPNGHKDPIRGIIVLCDGKGNPSGILASEEVTGYRTSMNVMVPFSWRKHVENIVIFGSGLQALWHTRLILTLRGEEVNNITYVSSTKSRVDKLIETVSDENQKHWKSSCSFDFLDNTTPDFLAQLGARLSEVDCIFCCTPSRKPLFPASLVADDKPRKPFIAAVGSWQTEMIELDPSLLRSVVTNNNGYNPLTGENNGVILVDDRDFALRSCGEVVQSQLASSQIVEAGEIIALKKEKPTSKPSNGCIQKMDDFISDGLVIYKSVGLSLTDLTVSNAILAQARKNKQGL